MSEFLIFVSGIGVGILLCLGIAFLLAMGAIWDKER